MWEGQEESKSERGIPEEAEVKRSHWETGLI